MRSSCRRDEPTRRSWTRRGRNSQWSSLGAVIELERTTTALAGLSQEHADLTAENRALQTRASTDRVTDLPNRAALEDALEREVERRLRHPCEGTELGVIMIDVDDFKTFNDTFGHRRGDMILQTVARAMASATRSSDLLARYGGDEFCVLLRQTTPADIAAVAERLRCTVESTPVIDASGVEVQVTISTGAALSSAGDRTAAAALIDRADAALYCAKADGGNSVTVAHSTGQGLDTQVPAL